MADAARETRPGANVLSIIGYAENVAVGNGYLDDGMQVLTKTFAVAAPAARIRDRIEA